MANQTNNLETLVQSLQKNFSSGLFTSLLPMLTRAKVLVAANHLLTPTPQTPPEQIGMARTVFEIGAFTSIHLKDKAGFVNYLGYLQNFYPLGLGGPKEAELTGLNLLRLLAENRISEFHTQLEIIDATTGPVAESEPVKFARGLEEWVMEGAYNRVWKAGEGQGINVYQKFFLDVLMDTIRNEIATCLERAYPSLPISDAQILLFFPPQDGAGFKTFAATRGWTISNMGDVSFPPLSSASPLSMDGDISEIPQSMKGVGGLGSLCSVGGEKILRVGLGYAEELEKVI